MPVIEHERSSTTRKFGTTGDDATAVPPQPHVWVARSQSPPAPQSASFAQVRAGDGASFELASPKSIPPASAVGPGLAEGSPSPHVEFAPPPHAAKNRTSETQAQRRFMGAAKADLMPAGSGRRGTRNPRAFARPGRADVRIDRSPPRGIDSAHEIDPITHAAPAPFAV